MKDLWVAIVTVIATVIATVIVTVIAIWNKGMIMRFKAAH